MKRKKRIRQDFRDQVFERDDYKCRVCDAENCELDAHHIVDRNDMPNGGYVVENGITLCEECHKKAELFHETTGEEWNEGMHPLDFYKMIGVTYLQAEQASERLK